MHDCTLFNNFIMDLLFVGENEEKKNENTFGIRRAMGY